MNVEFDEAFYTSLIKLKKPDLHSKILRVITQIERAKTLQEVPALMKLKGYSSYYRIRKGDYRIGLELVDNETLRFILIAHRKDIYQKFP